MKTTSINTGAFTFKAASFNMGRVPTEVFGVKFGTTFSDRRELILQNFGKQNPDLAYLLETSDMERVYPVRTNELPLGIPTLVLPKL